AGSLPSRLTSPPETPPCGPVAGRGAPMGWRVTEFPGGPVPPEPAVASSLPLGLNATTYTPWAWESVSRGALRWVTGSHSRIVPLLSTAASLPSGLNDSHIWPPWVWSGAPKDWRGAGVQDRTVGGSASPATSLPAGVDARPQTTAGAVLQRGARTGRAGRWWPGSTVAPCPWCRRWPAACRRG